MNIDQKKWFCMQCSLQFESSSVFDLHLKLLHKKVIEEETIETKPNLEECFNNDVELLAKSNKKDFVHERKKSSKCQFNENRLCCFLKQICTKVNSHPNCILSIADIT